MPTRKNRVTRWTDDRGNVLEDFKGALYRNALIKAQLSGLPSNLLHIAGWDGSEDDITGYFTDLVYQLVSIPLKGPVDMSDAEQIISSMITVCQSASVDYHDAIDFEWPRFVRTWRQDNDRRLRNEWPRAEDDGSLDMFGAPSGPEHDNHAHGLSSNGHWTCIEEKPSDDD